MVALHLHFSRKNRRAFPPERTLAAAVRICQARSSVRGTSQHEEQQQQRRERRQRGGHGVVGGCVLHPRAAVVAGAQRLRGQVGWPRRLLGAAGGEQQQGRHPRRRRLRSVFLAGADSLVAVHFAVVSLSCVVDDD